MRRWATSSGLSPPGRLPVRSHTTADGSAWTGTAGARDDARVALDYLRGRYPDLPFTVAGFSFGSRIALRLGCGIARRVIAVGFPAAYKDKASLENCTTPRVFIQSTHDQFGSVEQIESIVAPLPEPKQLRLVEAQDHFFTGALDVLEETVKTLPA